MVYGKHALQNFFTLAESKNYNWNESYQNAFFKVNVHTNIQSGMLITET